MNVIRKVRETIERYRLLQKGDRVVIAASGGPDSVCLMHALREMSAEYGLELLVAHLNHGLRGAEADRDERFVGDLAGELDMPFESARIDLPALLRTGGHSPEDLCREKRYEFLREALARHGFTKIALGHQQDDRVETVLMNFLRGSGLEGLRGFSPCRDGMYIRPLFEVSRGEILSWLEAKKASFVTDSTNHGDLYLRNRIRNRLIPQLRDQYNPRFSKNMITMSQILMDEDDFLSGAVEVFLKRWEKSGSGHEHETTLPVRELLASHPALQRRIVKAMLLRFSPAEKGIGYRHVQAVLDLAAGPKPGGSTDLPFGIRVRRQYDLLTFRQSGGDRSGRASVGKRGDGFIYPLEIPGTFRIDEAAMEIRIEVLEGVREHEIEAVRARNARKIYLDFERIAFPLSLRSVQSGDRIRPFGMAGSKKISDLFIDEKIPRAEREKIPLLTDRDDILWAVGIRVGRKASLTTRSRKILMAEII